MNTITKITGVHPIQLTNSSGPEVFIQCKGDEIARALRELTDRMHVLESQVNNLISPDESACDNMERRLSTQHPILYLL